MLKFVRTNVWSCLCISLALLAGFVELPFSARAELPPSVIWANRAGGPLPDSAKAIAADSAGNLYVAGVFSGTVAFGSTTLTAPAGSDLFLAKLSTNGVWLWAKDIEDLVPGIYPFYLQIDSSGSPVLAASIPGDVVGDGLNQLLVARFTSAGAPVWTRKFKPGSLASIIAGGMGIDAANNIYLTGGFGNQVNFGGTTLADSGHGDIFVLKLSTAGTTLAVKQFGQAGPVPDQGSGLVLDTLGNVYIAATFGGTINFGATALTSAGAADVALFKLDANLTPLWAKRLGDTGDDSAFQLTRDASNNLTLLGSFSEGAAFGTNRITPAIGGQLFATRFSPAGDFSWCTPLGIDFVDVSGSRGFVTDAAGNLFLASGPRLVKMDASGHIVWTRAASPTFGIKNLTGAAVLNATNLFISGSIPVGAANLDAITLTSAGSDDALIARLNINLTLPPTITAQPVPQTVVTGGSATFSVTASGAGPFTYQWYFGALPMAGRTNATLSLTNVQQLAGGIYYVVVGNAGGFATSASAQLTVNLPPPTITQQPISQTVDLGADARFTVTATGQAPLVYRWQLRGTNLPGQTTPLLALHGVRTTDAGPYTVIVGNSGGYTTSVVATLTIRVLPPVITAPPVDASAPEGASVSFSVAVSGSSPFTFRWLHNGVVIPNASSGTLTLNNVQDADGGAYAVSVSNSAGSVTSSPANLSLIHPILSGAPFTWSFLMPNGCGGAVTALSEDGSGNICLAANQPNMPIPGVANDTACGTGFAVAKLDSSGHGLWRSQAWGTSLLQTSVGNLQADGAGNVFVAGSFSGTITFGPLNAVGTTLTSTGGRNLFLAKYGPTGALLWVKRVTGAIASDLVADAAGNTFLAGSLISASTAGFGVTNITSATTRPFIARADPSGNFV